MQILLANDDGIHAPGLRALRDALQHLGEVQVVAPLAEQSGVSLRITYLHPIMVKEIRDDAGKHFGWAVDGSPADCVKLGVMEFCAKKPDLIVSGINSGSNVGINVMYSGTVAAAIEGAFFGIPSVAISLAQGTPPDYRSAAERSVGLLRKILEHQQDSAPRLWNVNFPNTTREGPKGIRLSTMGVRRITERVEKRTDPRGRPYYWSGLDPLKNQELEEGCDVKDLQEGYITMTPLHFDLTERAFLKRLQAEKWMSDA